MEERLFKLDKYYEAVTSKKQQRSELMINGTTVALNMKMTTRMKSVNQSVEDRPKNIRLNKRFRTSVAAFQAECQINGLKKQPVAMAEDVNILKDNGEESDQFEKIHGLTAVEEGWDKKIKRKRSIGTILSRPVNSDGVSKRAMQNRVADERGSQQHDARNSRLNNREDSYTTCPSPLKKKKALRSAEIGSMVASETREKWKNAMAKETLISQERGKNDKPTLGQWVGQRPPKVPRTRRSNLVSHVSNQDDCSPSQNSPVFRIAPIGPQKFIVKLDNVQSGNKESVGGERRLKGKMGNNEMDGISVQNRGPCVTLAKNTKESVNAGTPNGCKKNGSKPGRRLKKLSEYKGLSDNAPLENSSSPDFTGGSDDDELLKSANHARVASPHEERKTHTPHQQTKSLFKKYDMDHKTFNGSTPFYQRVLSALIIEDDNDIDLLQERNIQIQNSFAVSTSDTYRFNDSDPRKRDTMENKCDSTFTLGAQTLNFTNKKSPSTVHEDLTSKSFNACQYEEMCIDDKLLMELQSIGLCPDSMPGLEEKEDEMIHHEVNTTKTTLHQQEVQLQKEKRSLGRCNKFENSGKSCFNETPLKDIFSAPTKNEPEEASPVCWPVDSNPNPKLLSDQAFTINKPISNRGKKQKTFA